MNTVKLKDRITINLKGEMPRLDTVAKDFSLVKSDLSDVALSEFKGKKVVLNVFPSLDTEVCAASVRRFNQLAAGKENVAVLAVSMDLPFAMGRFCTVEGINNVIPVSGFRSGFGFDYGVEMADGPLAGLYARSVFVIDEKGKVKYVQLVPEITREPDYEAALAALE